MRVKPAKGRQVRHPEPPYLFLSEDGENVPESQYWLRRLVKGDTVLCEDPPAPKATAKKAEAPKADAVKE